MTQEQKTAILKYIQTKIKSNKFSSVLGSELLFYYLDHKDEIDPNKLIADQKQERIKDLQASITKAQAQLDVLTK